MAELVGTDDSSRAILLHTGVNECRVAAMGGGFIRVRQHGRADHSKADRAEKTSFKRDHKDSLQLSPTIWALG
jgi:hypothetical protein